MTLLVFNQNVFFPCVGSNGDCDTGTFTKLYCKLVLIKFTYFKVLSLLIKNSEQYCCSARNG